MTNFFKQSKFFCFFITFIYTSSLSAYENIYIPKVPLSKVHLSNVHLSNVQNTSFSSNITSKLFNKDGNLSYDAVIRLLEEIENEEIEEIYSEDDCNKITQLIIFLAIAGVLPNASQDMKNDLKKDIQELYTSFDDLFIPCYYDVNDYQIIPAIFYGESTNVHCKNKIKKAFKKVKEFVKKNKETIILIGTAVATVAIVATSIILSTPEPPPSYPDKESVNQNITEELPQQSFDNVAESNFEKPFEDHIYYYQNIITENNLLPEYLNQDNEKIIGSLLAHETLFNTYKNTPCFEHEKIFLEQQEKINHAFSTENIFPNFSEKTLTENIYFFQGQEALHKKNYDQAINHFGKIIEINPINPNVYLDRACAYLETGQIEHSLSDYDAYIKQKNEIKPSSTFNESVDFTVGMTSGIAKGSIESGKQLLCFATDFIKHPINTTCNVYDSLSILAKLAYSQEWNILKEALIPEVCELIDNWKDLSSKEKGEKSGYIASKYSSDILLPGAATKVISKGIKGGKELIIAAKNLQNMEKVLVLEALTESSKFMDVVCQYKRTEKFIPTSSGILDYLKNISFIRTKTDILNLIKPNGEWIGKAGTSERIRLFKGGCNESLQVFKELTKEGKIICKDSKKIISKLSDEIYITYRPISKSGPPTIDIRLSDQIKPIKMKFIE